MYEMQFQKLFTNVEWGWQIVKQHMIAGQFSSKSLKKSKALYTMQGVAIQLSIKNYSVSLSTILIKKSSEIGELYYFRPFIL